MFLGFGFGDFALIWILLVVVLILWFLGSFCLLLCSLRVIFLGLFWVFRCLVLVGCVLVTGLVCLFVLVVLLW